ncbi:MAG: mechanosensitive ion channel family protein [Acidobacteria bacterium]|nr:mechanosensitive ion channel family protein [Acidobacteriota bacterium]
MNEMLDSLKTYLATESGAHFLKAAVLLVLGLFVARLAGAATWRLLRLRMGAQSSLLGRRLVKYGTFVLFTVAALREAGFDLSVLLGAAGVLTVALGFASQTSVSNIISGLFLIGERAFEVGETVTIGDVTGEVLAVDWMSVKLRTFANLMVRLPNETVLKSQITNLSRFPIRRLDQQLGVAYGSDLDRVREILMAVAHDHPLCLDEPKPILFHKGFGDSAILLQFSVWFLTPNVVELKNSLPQKVAEAFEAAGIEIPFPQRTITFAGDASPDPRTNLSS